MLWEEPPRLQFRHQGASGWEDDRDAEASFKGELDYEDVRGGRNLNRGLGGMGSCRRRQAGFGPAKDRFQARVFCFRSCTRPIYRNRVFRYGHIPKGLDNGDCRVTISR